MALEIERFLRIQDSEMGDFYKNGVKKVYSEMKNEGKFKRQGMRAFSILKRGAAPVINRSISTATKTPSR